MWRDMLMEVKKDYMNAIIQQVSVNFTLLLHTYIYIMCRITLPLCVNVATHYSVVSKYHRPSGMP